jgi:hypothetical protein
MIASLAAALLLSTAPADDSRPTIQAGAAQTQASPGAADLGEITVDGRRLEDMTRDFVREIGAPSRNRGLARWREGVCVGVANLQPELSQYIVDRVSTVARDVGLRAGAPGCTPSVLVVAVSDANAFTPQFVAMRPRLFRVGGAGMDRGGAALEQFKTNDLPVRWWIVTAPVDDDTGQLATRTPGMLIGDQDSGAEGNVMLFAPNTKTRQASRLSTQIVDDTKRAFIIVDVDKLGDVSTEQLADYIAFITLAQIDPQADPSGYASILNVFDDPTQTPRLTQWDQAYLTGLYDAVRTRRNLGANASEIVASIVDTRRDMQRAETTPGD